MAGAPRRLDSVGGEQRAFDLHPVHILDARYAGAAHRRLDGGGRLDDLRRAANLVRRELSCRGDADRETLLRWPPIAAARRGWRRHAREDRRVWTEHALCATRYDDGDVTLHLGGRTAQRRGEHRGDRRAGELASEIVDAAIALGLDQDRKDVARVERALVDQAAEPGEIAGSRHGDPECVGAKRHTVHSGSFWRESGAAQPSVTPHCEFSHFVPTSRKRPFYWTFFAEIALAAPPDGRFGTDIAGARSL